jgi:hypothetical protein
LDGVLGDRASEFEEFAADAFGPPPWILGSHLLNQPHKVARQTRPTQRGPAPETPEEFETAAVPAEQGIGFENQESLFPRLKAAGEEQQGETVGAGQAGFLDLALDAKREEWLAQQGILQHEIRFGACRVEGEGQ